MKFTKDSVMGGLLLLMAAIWVGTYLFEGGYNTFWSGSAGMMMLPVLTAAMLVDVLF